MTETITTLIDDESLVPDNGDGSADTDTESTTDTQESDNGSSDSDNESTNDSSTDGAENTDAETGTLNCTRPENFEACQDLI